MKLPFWVVFVDSEGGVIDLLSENQTHTWSRSWRVIPFSKWLITMVSMSPKVSLFPFPTGLFWVFLWGDPNTTQDTWDGPSCGIYGTGN